MQPSFKNRKIHLDRIDCFTLTKSVSGSQSLSSPLYYEGVVNCRSQQLLPIYRTRKQKMNISNNLSGFQSAAEFHKQNVCPDLSPNKSSQQATCNVNEKGAKYSPKSNNAKYSPKSSANQKLLTSFFKTNDPSCSSSISTAQTTFKDSDQNCNIPRDFLSNQSPSSSQERTTTKMFSPIKLLPNSQTIYISDSDSNLTPKKESDKTVCSISINKDPKRNVLQPKDVVKALFDGQKNLKPNQQMGRKRKAKKDSTVPSKFPRFRAAEVMKECEEINSSDDDALCSVPETSDKKFGLLGHLENTERINYFDQLPDEILENIFCQLPLLDLCLNCNRVCTRWNSVISAEKFMKWKKQYYKVKKDDESARSMMFNIMTKNGMKYTKDYLTSLIRYFKSAHSFAASVSVDILNQLQKHKKYTWAKALMVERFPELINDGHINPWCLVAALVVISETVGDIQEMISCLSQSVLTTTDMLELLYCLASLLLMMTRLKRDTVWNGMHYRLFYALYLYENSFVSHYGDLKGSAKGGQQSIVSYSRSDMVVRLTHEQLRIVNHNVSPGQIIKIIAFAGTGKTTTLVRYTQMRPSMKFLLVVYNRSVCDYAKTKFPRNVTCQTGHALAYRFVGRKYKDAEKLKDLSVYATSQVLKPRKGDNLFIRAKLVLETLKHFFSSKDDNITIDHTPVYRLNDNGLMVEIELDKRNRYVEDAEYLWQRMKNYNDKEVSMTFDGYLKLYSLMRPQISGYNCILIDEAQDLTPAISHLLLNQHQAKILVGDPHQQIYSFRGAVNALQQIEASQVFYLTQSFRFGPQISRVANCCLEVLKNEKKTLVGHGKPCTVYGEQVGQVAVLCRCNFTVFSEAVKKCCYSESNEKVAFVGGTDNFGFPMLQDLYTLFLPPEERDKQKRTIENKLVKNFGSFVEFEKFALKTNDVELLGKIKIVRTYNHNLPFVINKILLKTTKDQNTADIIFSTVHKAKGLEFSTVRVMDDFLIGQENTASLQREQNMDEANLLYVAVTRAKNSLQMTQTLVDLLAQSGEKFEYPVLSSSLQSAGVVMKCKETDAEFTPHALTLQQKDIKLSNHVKVNGGLYGPQILTEENHPFTGILGNTEKKDVDEKT